MDRDFLRLSILSGPSLDVKQEVNDDSKISGAKRSSEMQWSFSNKVSAVPQLLSFKAHQGNNRPRKAVDDPLGPSTLMTISCPDTIDTTYKTFSPGTIQRNFVQEKQNGNHYSIAVHNQLNQTIPVSLNTHVFQSTVRPQPFGGLPIVPSLTHVPSIGSVVGTTDLGNGPSKPSTAPAQLTIFYGGSVNVFEDISPEKAQAIMYQASNSSSVTRNEQVPLGPLEVSAPRASTADGFSRSWSFSGVSTPIPMTIRPDTQFGGSNNTGTLGVVKTVGASATSSNLLLPEGPKVVSSVGPCTTATTVIPTVAVPQARKASLARFLEKRKERVISASPYNLPSISSDGMNLSIGSNNSAPLSAMN